MLEDFKEVILQSLGKSSSTLREIVVVKLYASCAFSTSAKTLIIDVVLRLVQNNKT